MDEKATSNEQNVTSNKQKVTSNEQTLTSNEQKRTNNEQRAKRSASMKCMILKFIINHHRFQTPQKLSCPLGLFGLKGFHSFVILARREDGTYILSSVLFGDKKWEFQPEIFLQRTISNMTGSSKNIYKTSKCSNKNTRNKSNIITYIFRWIHIVFSLPTSIVKWKNLVQSKKGSSQILKNICHRYLFLEFQVCFLKELMANFEKYCHRSFFNFTRCVHFTLLMSQHALKLIKIHERQ